MNPIERVAHGGETHAIIARREIPHQGYNFISDDQDSLQVGINHYKKNSFAKPHYHPPLNRNLTATVEFLHIDHGCCELTLFTEGRVKFYQTILNAGDNVVLLKGGHSLRIIEDTRIVEVKQGPYFGPELDKIFFEPISTL